MEDYFRVRLGTDVVKSLDEEKDCILYPIGIDYAVRSMAFSASKGIWYKSDSDTDDAPSILQ